jgi:Rrf2 family protein
MQHAFQISRKIEYGTRAMLYLSSLPDGMTTSFKEIGRQMAIPQQFLAKILKKLVSARLVRSIRGSHGGYSLARPASQISFLDVIEAVEGTVTVNVCTSPDHLGCSFADSCSMQSLWQQGQERMRDVYRSARLDKLAMRSLTHRSPVVTSLEAR